MEFDENKEEEKYSEDDYVDIYSKRAIFWFSFFNLIFGGVLLVINLYNAGYRKAVPVVLAFVLFFPISPTLLSCIRALTCNRLLTP
ncbi:hypothetical protein ACRQ5D_23560 [Mucilaginibacter sp. P25]|uniref:hypothetical protein n=1 Tax=Mucilaginibacter sp. P25 TaxID=3423945 RepID=UPI003D79047A